MEYVGTGGEHWRPKNPMKVDNNECGDYSRRNRVEGELPHCVCHSEILFKGEVIYSGDYDEIRNMWDELVFDLTTPKQECIDCLKKDVQIAKLECSSKHGNRDEIESRDETIKKFRDLSVRLLNVIEEYEKAPNFKCPICGSKYNHYDRTVFHKPDCWKKKAHILYKEMIK